MWMGLAFCVPAARKLWECRAMADQSDGSDDLIKARPAGAAYIRGAPLLVHPDTRGTVSRTRISGSEDILWSNRMVYILADFGSLELRGRFTSEGQRVS